VVNASKAQGTATAGNFTLIHRFVAHSSMQVRKHLKGTRPQCDNNCSTLKKSILKYPTENLLWKEAKISTMGRNDK